jgi:sec-independent protein translocase protein TatC
MQQGFIREQFRAALRGEPAAVVNRFPRPTAEQKEGTSSGSRKFTEADIYKLWVRQEEPLREAVLRQMAANIVGKRPSLKTLSPTEVVVVYFKAAVVCGIVFGSPWIFGQIWAFVAAGLYPYEKRSVHLYLPFSVGLFLAGVALCEFWVLPQSVAALLGFNEWLDFEPDFRLSEWLGFAVWMPVLFGLSFQTPLVMLVAGRLGMVTVAGYRRSRKLAWFLLAALAALVTPSPDAQNMLLL